MARSLIAQGKTTGVTKHVNLARDAFARALPSEKSPNSSIEETKWLECLELLGEFETALTHLNSRLENDEAGDWAHHAVAQICVSQFDVQARGGRAASKTAITALETALQHRPDHESIVKRLIVCANQIPAQSDRCAEALQQLSGATLTSHVDLVVGSVLHGNGHLAAAIDHLEQAYLRDPDDPAIMNNLAFYLSQAPMPDLDRALQIANELIQKNPSILDFQETRGQIYVQQENWEAGRRDLEAAEKSMPAHLPLHEALFLVYQKLDLPHLAANRARLVDKLLKSAATN